MRAKKSILLLLCAAGPVLAGGALLCRFVFMPPDLPNGHIALRGLYDPVIIRRDSFGVPLIEAKNERDLFFAAGFCAAGDRLWQMAMARMVMRGRLAEVIGVEGARFDVFMRTAGIASFVDETMRGLDPKSRVILEDFSRGVNAYLATQKRLPLEFALSGMKPEQWRPEDSLYVFSMLNLNVSANLVEELSFLIAARALGYEKAAWLFPIYPDEDLPFKEAKKLSSIPHEKLLDPGKWASLCAQMVSRLSLNVPASNNWALAGWRTEGGKSVIANDTHLSLALPNHWMLVHLKCPAYEAAGVAIPGVPLVTLGYNGRVAWGATMVMADTQDLFMEKLKRDKGRLLWLYKGAWLPVSERKEKIMVKGGSAIELSIARTHHGPLLNEALARMPFPPKLDVQPLPMESGFGIALSWAMSGGAETFQGLYELGLARNAGQAQRAIKKLRGICLNIVYGDARSIGWQVTGTYPLRRRGSGFLPSPGWDGEYDWCGFLPAEKLPGSSDPPQGFLATANNRTVEKGFPHVLGSSWFSPVRAERIRHILAKTRNARIGDMQSLQFDRTSLLAERIQAMLFSSELSSEIKKELGSLRDQTEKRRVLDALEMLRPGHFDNVMDADSSSAAVLGAFLHCFVHETFGDELGAEGTLLREAFDDVNVMSYGAPEDHLLRWGDSPFFDRTGTPRIETKADIVIESLQKAMALCEERMGESREDWRWGRLHTYTWRHEMAKEFAPLGLLLNRGPFPAGGDGHTLNAASFVWGRSFEVWLIPAMRMVVDFNREEPVCMVIPMGQSCNYMSAHYDDMLPLFLEGRLHPLPFNETNARRQHRDVLELAPLR